MPRRWGKTDGGGPGNQPRAPERAQQREARDVQAAAVSRGESVYAAMQRHALVAHNNRNEGHLGQTYEGVASVRRSGCDGIPNGNTVRDECGVCGDDSSSCADCSGTSNGPLEMGEIRNAQATAEGNAEEDTSTEATFSGNMVQYPDFPESRYATMQRKALEAAIRAATGAQMDACGKCGGDGTTCLDCAGVETAAINPGNSGGLLLEPSVSDTTHDVAATTHTSTNDLERGTDEAEQSADKHARYAEAKRVFRKFKGQDKATMSADERVRYSEAKDVLRQKRAEFARFMEPVFVAAPADEDEDNLKLCVVCLDRERSYAYVQCGHLCVCGTCVIQVADKCPMCRAPSTREPVKIFLS